MLPGRSRYSRLLVLFHKKNLLCTSRIIYRYRIHTIAIYDRYLYTYCIITITLLPLSFYIYFNLCKLLAQIKNPVLSYIYVTDICIRIIFVYLCYHCTYYSHAYIDIFIRIA